MVQAGIIARNDALYNQNQPAAGVLGISKYAIGLSQVAWTDANREELNTAGVNVARLIKYVASKGKTTNVNQGNFYFSFSIGVTDP